MAIQKEEAGTVVLHIREMLRTGQEQEAFTLIDQQLEEMMKCGEMDWRVIQLAVKICNKIAGKSIRVDLLRRAEGWLRLWKGIDTSPAALFSLEKWQMRTAISLSKAFVAQQKYHKAMLSLMKAFKEVKGKKSRLEAEIMLEISAFYIEIRSFSEAEDYATKALAVLQTVLKAKADKRTVKKLSQSYVLGFALLAKAEQGLGHRQRSLQAHRTGLSIAKEHLSPPCKPTIPSTSPRLSTVPQPPPKDRYYSDDKLTNLHRKLTQKHAIPFISTDQFFANAISKWLKQDQSSTPNRARPLSASGINTARVRDEEERRKVAELRDRMHPNRANSSEIRGKEYILGRIRRLEDETERGDINRKRVVVRKDKPGKAEKSPYPPQSKLHIGLFFKPADGQIADSTLDFVPIETIRTSLRSVNAKDDMEQLISEIEKDISTVKTRFRKRQKGDLHADSVVSPTCELAQSVRFVSTPRVNQRNFSRKGDSMNIEALALKLKRRKTTLRHKTVSFSSNQTVNRLSSR
jgi:hypothetical protein